MECVFMNEAEELAVIKYVVTVDEADRFGRKYGISISVINDGDTRSLKSIFFTYEEAEMTAEFLCRTGIFASVKKMIRRESEERRVKSEQ